MITLIILIAILIIIGLIITIFRGMSMSWDSEDDEIYDDDDDGND